MKCRLRHGLAGPPSSCTCCISYRIFHLPLPVANHSVARILADLDERLEVWSPLSRTKLERWYWNGGFFVSFTAQRSKRAIARDFIEVPAWLKWGPEPTTVSETMSERTD